MSGLQDVRFSRRIPRVLAGLTPLWVVAVQAIAVPRASDQVFASPPAMFGLPAGVLLLAIALSLMAAGLVVLARTTSIRSAIGAFVFLTVPSTALVLVAPAIILAILRMAPQI